MADTLTIGKDADAIDAMYSNTLKDFAVGSIVPGKVLRIQDDEVLVDIGYKSEGIVDGDEFQDISAVQVGDTI
jgi:small subunit ribosomal protein S1